MDAMKIMEGVTLVVTIGMLFSGLVPSYKMFNTGDTRNVPYFMFLLSTISCLGMLHYAVFINISTLIFINGLGVFLNASYTAVYMFIVKDKTRPARCLSAIVSSTALLYLYLYTWVETEEARAQLLGSVSSSITTVLVCLPAIELIDNFKNRNANGMPWTMVVMALATGFSWLIYGLMLEDLFIYGPNIPGMFTYVLKLCVFQLYGQKDPNANKKNL